MPQPSLWPFVGALQSPMAGCAAHVPGGLRTWLAESVGGPDGLGLRFVITLLLPK